LVVEISVLKEDLVLKKPLLIAVIAAIIFALAVFLFLQGQEATRPVVVAAQDMPIGTVVDETMLKIINVPVGSLIGDETAISFAEIVGKTVVFARAAGDLVPLRALGEARMMPAAGNGFITVTIPVQDSLALMIGDEVAFSVFDHAGGAELIEGFVVKGVARTENNAHLLLEGHKNEILVLSPFLATQSFILVRKAGN